MRMNTPASAASPPAHADIVLAVTPDRIPSFTTAYTAAAANPQLIQCANFSEARAWLDQHGQPGDVVLIENDLPDLYEYRLRL